MDINLIIMLIFLIIEVDAFYISFHFAQILALLSTVYSDRDHVGPKHLCEMTFEVKSSYRSVSPAGLSFFILNICSGSDPVYVTVQVFPVH